MQPTSSNYVEKTFVHEVSESDEENMRLLLKKASLIKLKGSLFCSIFSLFLLFKFPYMWWTEKFFCGLVKIAVYQSGMTGKLKS
jgi:hypothetical protein